jgi:hypothetical protein
MTRFSGLGSIYITKPCPQFKCDSVIDQDQGTRRRRRNDRIAKSRGCVRRSLGHSGSFRWLDEHP